MLCITGILGLIADQARQSINLHLNIRNNLWNHYNFKSLKSKLYEIEKNRLALGAEFVGQDLQTKTLLPILTNNLDRELRRYKKEQSDIQAEAVHSDTNFELAKRKYLVFSIGFLLSFLGLITYIIHLILCLEKLLWPKIIVGVLVISSLIITVHTLL